MSSESLSSDDSASAQRPLRLAVIGAGISGLAACLRLMERFPESEAQVRLYEARERAGGVLQTIRRDGYLIECAADNFLRGPTAPWAEKFCQRYDWADQLLPTNTANRGAHVVRDGRLHPVPEGFQLLAPSKLTSILRSPLLSWRGRLRLMLEPLIREPANVDDESLTSFATRRLGREAFERLVQPLVGGIYTADSDRLSVAAALPQMMELVRNHGSLYAGMLARRRAARAQANDADTRSAPNARNAADRGARYSLFVAPREGMSDWMDQIVSRISEHRIQYGTRLTELRAQPDGTWQLCRDREVVAEADAVIIATPVHVASNLLKTAEPELAQSLAAIRSASSAVVCLAYDDSQIRHPLDAFGCVVPAAENRNVLAISYASNKFPGRAPEGKRLLRVFMGGALQPELLTQDDDALAQLARAELKSLLGATGEPELTHVVRWPNAMPQYEIGHLERVAKIEEHVAAMPRLAIAGSGFRGVGIPQCIRSGEAAADQLYVALETTERTAVR